MTVIDISGQRFGRLVVLGREGKRHGQALWRCQCDCGSTKSIVGNTLRRGLAQSCGCLQRERTAVAKTTHGGRNSKLYKQWYSMVERCHCHSSHAFADYGGRGITVCERWHDFSNFRSDMGERPPGMSIERLDNSKGYEPGNCAWATPAQQARNKRNNVMLRLGDREMCLADWANHLGLSRGALRGRLRRGWSIERTLCPLPGRGRAVTAVSGGDF